MEGEGDDVRPVAPRLEGGQSQRGSRDEDQQPLPDLGDEIEHGQGFSVPVTSVKDAADKEESHQLKREDEERVESSTGNTYGSRNLDEISKTIHGLGDLIWCRAGTPCFYPAMVVNDPFLKFCTKIVVSDKSSSSEKSSSTGPSRQYHVQMIGDNRLLWVQDKYCLPYSGLADYEQIAMQDGSNIRMYKPKSDRVAGWKHCIASADELLTFDKSHRIKQMESSRNVGNKSFMKSPNKECNILSPENPSPFKAKEDSSMKIKGTISSSLKPQNIVSPPKQQTVYRAEELLKPKAPFSKKNEMKYKLSKHQSTKSKDSEKNMENKPNNPSPSFVPIFHSNVKFEKSFKVKKKIEHEPEFDKSEADTDSAVTEKKEIHGKNKRHVDYPAAPDDTKKKKKFPRSKMNDNEHDTKFPEKSNRDLKVEKADVEKEDKLPVPQEIDKDLNEECVENIDIDTVVDIQTKLPDVKTVKDYTPGEGSLVWAKMRGYSFWPAIVSRDPISGKFDKIKESVNKTSRSIHVLFLEYRNERAWIGVSSTKQFKGLEDFNQERDKASKKSRVDYEPKKRYLSAFKKAVDYAEELKSFSDEDRLERVLLNYGWDFVEEGKSNSEGKLNRSEMNQSPDNENDSVAYSPDVTSSPSLSRSRRSSGGEAESKIDPSIDDEPVATSPDKKSSSAAETSAAKKRKQPGDTPQPKLKAKQAKLGVEQSGASSSSAQDAPDFPMVGDLVWGRMSGFPWWPSFVTRSPENIFKKSTANGKFTYHVQFFGWNDESGWVSSVMHFDGLDAFKVMKAKRKSDKSFSPGKGAQQKKWEKAVSEAEDTMAMTRQERIDQFLVSYAHKVDVAAQPASQKTPKSKTAKKSVSKTPASTPGGTPKAAAASTSKSGTPVKNYHGSNKRMSVPKGWLSKTVAKDGKSQVIYISPEGKEFSSKAAMYREISVSKEGKSEDGGVSYLQDSSLPAGWRCQIIQSRVYFFSPLGERFTSREAVADRMRSDPSYTQEHIDKLLAAVRRRPAPKSVLISRGHYTEDEEEEEDEDEKDAESLTSSDKMTKLPNGLMYRFGGKHDAYLDIDRLFDQTDGGKIDLVQLPDIFLEHPTVVVEEENNVMIIKDVDTLDFIAKKIIYE